jgi:hypothetical protein
VSAETEVTLKYTVDVSGAQKGTKDLAKDTKDLGAAAKDAQKQFDAAAEARRRLQRAHNEEVVKAEMNRLRPPAPKPAKTDADHAREMMDQQAQGRRVQAEYRRLEVQQWRNTPAGQRSLLAPGQAGRMASAMAPLAGVAAFAHLATGAAASAAHGIGDLAADRASTTGGTVAAGESARMFASGLVEAIPVVGTFKKSVEDLATASTRAAAKLEMVGVVQMERQAGAARNEIGLRAGGQRQLYGIEQGVGDAAADAKAARGYANSLTPEKLATYRGAYGDLYEQADQAGSRVSALREQVASRQQALGSSTDAYGDAKARAEDAARNAAGAGAKASAASRALENWQADFGHTSLQGTSRALARGEVGALGNALSTGISAGTANKAATEQATTVQQQLNDLQQKQVELAKAELEQRRAILAVNQKMVQENVSGAIKFGGGTRAEIAQYGALARQFQKGGIESLTPEQRDELERGPLGSLVTAAKKELGAKGMEEEGIGDIKAQMTGSDINRKSLKDQEDEVRKGAAGDQADFAQQKADIAKTAGTKLAEVVKEVLNLAIEQFRQELVLERQREALNNRGR